MKLTTFFSTALCVLNLLAADLVLAQTASTQGLNTDRKQAAIAKTELEPVLDGILDDPIWQQQP